METKVLFEDKDLLVLDKPAGMIVNKADTTKDLVTVQDFVEKYLKIRIPKSSPRGEAGEIRNKSQISNLNTQNSFEFRDSNFEFARRAGIAHRLDKETSGILLVAKTLEAFINLQAQFKERKIQKTYVALAHGEIEPEEGEINVSVGRLPWNRKRFGVIAEGRESVTKYKVLGIKYKVSEKEREPLSLLELSPKTGRTHQIRVHLQYIHHPIFSDLLYAGRKTSRNDRKLLPRVFLHAAKISFYHPRTNEVLSFESPLPEDLNGFLARLKS